VEFSNKLLSDLLNDIGCYNICVYNYSSSVYDLPQTYLGEAIEKDDFDRTLAYKQLGYHL